MILTYIQDVFSQEIIFLIPVHGEIIVPHGLILSFMCNKNIVISYSRSCKKDSRSIARVGIRYWFWQQLQLNYPLTAHLGLEQVPRSMYYFWTWENVQTTKNAEVYLTQFGINSNILKGQLYSTVWQCLTMTRGSKLFLSPFFYEKF